jgi:ABC-type antimicrobial peptide transport system permease subunit
VVGVVNNTTPIAPGTEILPSYFTTIQGQRYLEAKIWVRYRGDVTPVIAQADTFGKRIDPLVNLSATTVEQDVRLALTPVRMASIALTALGGLALALATVGLFGVIAFVVGRRYREIAIRIAMGAESREIVGFVVRQGATPIVVGIIVGTVLAVATGFVARTLLFGLSPLDPIVIGGVLLAIGIAALIAFWLPTKRATGVDPANVLRVD